MTPRSYFQPGPTDSHERSNRRVLVVDDDAPKRYSMVRSLSAAGYTVDEAATGSDGIAKLRGHDAVVLDVHLPDLSGFEVCRAMKRISPALPVVQVSSVFTQASYRAAGKLVGASAYLADPDVSELVQAVDAAIARR